MCDTLAILLVLLGLIVINGASLLSLKLGLIIVLLWFASPVSSHLLAHMEVIVSSKLKDNCELPGQEEGGWQMLHSRFTELARKNGKVILFALLVSLLLSGIWRFCGIQLYCHWFIADNGL